MKKLLLLITCFLSGITSFAQEIEYDKTENGERSIMCKYENVRSMKDKTVFSVSLMAEQDKEKNVFYFLSLKTTSNTPITVAKGGTLLIKLNDDSILELHTQMEYAGTVRDVHNINGFVYSDYTIHPAFAINEEQIKKNVRWSKENTTRNYNRQQRQRIQERQNRGSYTGSIRVNTKQTQRNN